MSTIREKLINSIAPKLAFELQDKLDIPAGTAFYSKEITEIVIDALLDTMLKPSDAKAAYDDSADRYYKQLRK